MGLLAGISLLAAASCSSGSSEPAASPAPDTTVACEHCPDTNPTTSTADGAEPSEGMDRQLTRQFQSDNDEYPYTIDYTLHWGNGCGTPEQVSVSNWQITVGPDCAWIDHELTDAAFPVPASALGGPPLVFALLYECHGCEDHELSVWTAGDFECTDGYCATQLTTTSDMDAWSSANAADGTATTGFTWTRSTDDATFTMSDLDTAPDLLIGAWSREQIDDNTLTGSHTSYSLVGAWNITQATPAPDLPGGYGIAACQAFSDTSCS